MEKLIGYDVVQVACGASHVLAVTLEHQVFSWGRGDNGRLGLGHQDSCSVPTEVFVNDKFEENCDPQSEFKPCGVMCGIDCSMILTTSGKLLATGNNR